MPLATIFSVRPGRWDPSPPLANGFLCCQGRWCPSLPPALRNRRAAQARAHCRDSLSVDQVHFEDLYQVHRPCLRSPSEPLWVYLVHPLKSHLVHLTMKATGFPCCQGRRRPVSPPATGFLRRQGRHDPSSPSGRNSGGTSGRIRPLSGPKFFKLVDCRRASAAAGSSQNSRRATLTAAPGYARRWCTIETHHLRRKHLTSPRREQPRRVLRGCDSPSGIQYHLPFHLSSQSVMRNYLIINKRRKSVVPPEGTTDFHKTFSVSSLPITLPRGVSIISLIGWWGAVRVKRRRLAAAQYAARRLTAGATYGP